MKYFNDVLGEAVIEVLERHKDEIIKALGLDISYEEIEKSMQSKSIKLLKEISAYIDESQDEPSEKVNRIKALLRQKGIFNNQK